MQLINSYSLHLTMYIVLTTTVWLIYKTAPREFCLGIKLPPDRIDDPFCINLNRRNINGIIVIAFVIGVLIYVIARLFGVIGGKVLVNVDVLPLSLSHLLFVIGVDLWSRLYLRSKLLKKIDNEKWFQEQASGKITVDTSFHAKKRSISPLWLLVFPIIIYITYKIYGVFRPELFTDTYRDFYQSFGVDAGYFWPYKFITTSQIFELLKNFALTAQICTFMWTIVIFIGCAIARQELDPRETDLGLDRELKRRRSRQTLFILANAWLCIFVGLYPYVFIPRFSMIIIAGLWIPTNVVLIVYLFYNNSRAGYLPNVRKVGGVKQSWFSYNNPNDPALFLWSPSGFGIQLNRGNPFGKKLFYGCFVTKIILFVVCCYFCTFTSMMPDDDYLSKHYGNRDGAAIFAQAAFRNGIAYDTIAAGNKTGNNNATTAEGTIELYEITYEPNKPTNDLPFDRTIEKYLDKEITFEEWSEMLRVTKIRSDRAVFGDAEKAEYLKKNYPGFDFRTMGRLEGFAEGIYVDSQKFYAHRFKHKPLEYGSDFKYPNDFVKDSSILSAYFGYDLFRIKGTGVYADNRPTVKIESINYLTPGRVYSRLCEVEIDQYRDFLAPKINYRRNGLLSQAYRSSDYFQLNKNCWVPRHYVSVKSEGFGSIYWPPEMKKITLIRVEIDR